MLHSWPEGVAGIRIKRLGWAGNPSVPLETETAIVNNQDQTGMSRTRTVFDRLSGPIQGFSTVITPSHPTSPVDSPAADILRQLATPTVSRQRTVTAPNNKSPNQRACWITSAASLREPYPPPQLTSQAGPSGFARRRYALSPYTQHTLTHDARH